MLSLDDACMILFCVELGARIVVGTMDVKQLLLLNFYFWLDAASISPFVFEQFIKLQTMMFCEQRSKADSWDGWSANASYVWEANASDTSSLGDSTGALEVSSSCGGSIELPAVILSLQLLRVLRALKLMRHLFDLRVLTVALAEAGRPVLLPAAAMMVVILVLSGALWLLETDPESEDAFGNAFDALWCVFWLVCSLGFDGPMGTGGVSAKLIIATAVASGLVLTTMPITIIGEAFANAWNRKELLTLQARVNDELVKRALTVNDFRLLFAEIDANEDGELDWAEFKAAMRKLGLFLPNQKMRSLFEKLDFDSQGSVSCAEMSRVLFPDHDWEELAQDKKKLQRSIEEAAAVVIQKCYRGSSVRVQAANVVASSGCGSIRGATASLAAARATGKGRATDPDSKQAQDQRCPIQVQHKWLNSFRAISDGRGASGNAYPVKHTDVDTDGEHRAALSSHSSRSSLQSPPRSRWRQDSSLRQQQSVQDGSTPEKGRLGFVSPREARMEARMERLEHMLALSLTGIEQLGRQMKAHGAPTGASTVADSSSTFADEMDLCVSELEARPPIAVLEGSAGKARLARSRRTASEVRVQSAWLPRHEYSDPLRL